MKVLILEDEALSAKRASQLLMECDPEAEIVGVLESVDEAVSWLSQHEEPDLMLLDIHLSDGLCFSIFDQVSVCCPVIFTTAYDQYALQAFKTNSIDYLLKPLDKSELNQALTKYHTFKPERTTAVALDLGNLKRTLQSLTKKYKTRFLVKLGDTILFKNVEDVAYFFADDKVVFMMTTEGKKYLIDGNLEGLEEVLDPDLFFRVNRKLIVKVEAIVKVKPMLSSRLQVFLKPAFSQEIYVSKYKSQEFKAWLDN